MVTPSLHRTRSLSNFPSVPKITSGPMIAVMLVLQVKVLVVNLDKEVDLHVVDFTGTVDIPASGLKIAGTDVTASAAELNKVSDISANGFTLIGKTKSEMKAYLEISQSNSCNTSQAVACNNATNGAPGLQGAQGPQRRAGVNGTNGVCTCHYANSASNNYSVSI
jgi:hypothetical protein